MKASDEEMGMSDEQFEVYNALINFINELIEEEDDNQKSKDKKERLKNILSNNK
ncbi:MAG: hypothetical protein ACI4EK_06195 [Wujia sp.]